MQFSPYDHPLSARPSVGQSVSQLALSAIRAGGVVYVQATTTSEAQLATDEGLWTTRRHANSPNARQVADPRKSTVDDDAVQFSNGSLLSSTLRLLVNGFSLADQICCILSFIS